MTSKVCNRQPLTSGVILESHPDYAFITRKGNIFDKNEAKLRAHVQKNMQRFNQNNKNSRILLILPVTVSTLLNPADLRYPHGRPNSTVKKFHYRL